MEGCSQPCFVDKVFEDDANEFWGTQGGLIHRRSQSNPNQGRDLPTNDTWNTSSAFWSLTI